MKILFLLLCVPLAVFPFIVESRQAQKDPNDAVAQLKAAIDGLISRLDKAENSNKKIFGTLARQMMLQQQFVEERIRSEAYSGVKQIRLNREGTRNYYGQSHTSSRRLLAMHDHSNNDRTVGMGEIVAVLNGVEFRTRHNDYRLYMPHRTSKDLRAVEDIPFPDVPPEVTSKGNVSEQIIEMREWFKAWKNQNSTVRDYRKYFKPVLCYLEGAWTKAEKKIDKPFESDRHFLDASSWFDLQEKVRFESYTGRKHSLENFSFLPRTIMNVTEDGIPQFAQWNYRILCHPLKRDVPLNRFRVVDEVGPRLSGGRTYKEHSMSVSARFKVNPYDKDAWREGRNTKNFGLLDKLMGEIPGKDNYQGNLTDEAFGFAALSLEPGKQSKVRADRYHRWFKASRRDAMGVSKRHRGFSDENLFMAMNTQPKIPGMDLTTCLAGKCKTVHQKWSYAIPLEIIYLTPLSKWNPYDIEYKGAAKSPYGETVTANGRNGDNTLSKAYNGTNSKTFYQTPAEFFWGNEIGSGAADTTMDSVGVLDRKGNLRLCKASGTRLFFPLIYGIGTMRQRYPIMPVHGEGSAVWKELEAMKDVLLHSQSNGYILREPFKAGGRVPTEPRRKDITFQMRTARKKSIGPHKHELTLTADEVDFVTQGGTQVVTTTTAAGHEHTVSVKAYKNKKTKKWVFYIERCDDKDYEWKRCWDKHPKTLVQMQNQ